MASTTFRARKVVSPVCASRWPFEADKAIDAGAEPHRRVHRAGVALHVRDHIVAGHEAIGVGAVVGHAGQHRVKLGATRVKLSHRSSQAPPSGRGGPRPGARRPTASASSWWPGRPARPRSRGCRCSPIFSAIPGGRDARVPRDAQVEPPPTPGWGYPQARKRPWERVKQSASPSGPLAKQQSGATMTASDVMTRTTAGLGGVPAPIAVRAEQAVKVYGKGDTAVRALDGVEPGSPGRRASPPSWARRGRASRP